MSWGWLWRHLDGATFAYLRKRSI